ncbi:MAG: glycoside hydrolase family 43 protein [Acidobacteria bacterium]|nr:glycoside hydrolase family 43 protein [Acidobacteriota bacterium]
MDIFSETYLNPVYPKSFPDPFVLKFRGEYFAYCTDFGPDGRVFGVLRSRNLVDWTEIGGAMTPLDSGPPFYWAPEVVYSNGKFYLYYSAGNETLMELRVAVSERPDGGFVDSGRRLTFEDFAIDGHVFVDDDGRKYFFYATDFLDHSHIGTGTVVDRMTDLFTLEGRPRPVTRARYDWQVYDAARQEKGGVRWHTVEGPFILKRKGVYYEMFSGGNWQNVTYGVSFATTDDLDRPAEWEQFCDGEKTLPILRTLPGKVVGPGHNSVIRGPNNRELFCVYHRWTEQGRVLAIDRLEFAGGGRIFINGATTTPQPRPYAPRPLDFFDDFSGENWERIAGDWTVADNELVSGPTAEIDCRREAGAFLLETGFRALDETNGGFGVALKDENAVVFRLCFLPGERAVRCEWTEDGRERAETAALDGDFDFRAFHLLRLEADHRSLKIRLDGRLLREAATAAAPRRVSFFSEDCRAAFSGFALTPGFENLFEADDLTAAGWTRAAKTGSYEIANRNLILTARAGKNAALQKEADFENYELVFNVAFVKIFDGRFRFGFSLHDGERRPAHVFSLVRLNDVWMMEVEDPAKITSCILPVDFSVKTFRQFGFVKTDGRMHIRMETEKICTVDAVEKTSKIVFFVENASAAIDMIRVTAL